MEVDCAADHPRQKLASTDCDQADEGGWDGTSSVAFDEVLAAGRQERIETLGGVGAVGIAVEANEANMRATRHSDTEALLNKLMIRSFHRGRRKQIRLVHGCNLRSGKNEACRQSSRNMPAA